VKNWSGAGKGLARNIPHKHERIQKERDRMRRTDSLRLDLRGGCVLRSVGFGPVGAMDMDARIRVDV